MRKKLTERPAGVPVRSGRSALDGLGHELARDLFDDILDLVNGHVT